MPKKPSLLVRMILSLLKIALAVLVLGSLLVLLFQERIIYFPRPYDSDELAAVRPSGAWPLTYTTSQGKQTAFYLPPAGVAGQSTDPPAALWIVFSGNGSVALDWLELLHEHTPDASAAYLMVDYPGYGACPGKPSPSNILESSRAALAALRANFAWTPESTPVRLLGHSLGAASALQFAADLPPGSVRRIVLISPFTSMMDMAGRRVGFPVRLLLRHRFDNRASLARLASQPSPPPVALLHGVLDDSIPVAMSRELHALQPGFTTLQEIPDADHNSILYRHWNKISAAMQAK